MEFKPCPFCGGSARLLQSYGNRTESYYVFIKCHLCGAQTRALKSREEPAATNWENIACKNALIAWNRRAVETVEESRPYPAEARSDSENKEDSAGFNSDKPEGSEATQEANES